jgi:RNA polymerase sigma-70 factor (ECF subfamily)
VTPAPDVQEGLLVARAAAGDRHAFAGLVQAHQGYLRKLLGRVCRGEARFRTWLTRLAYSALSAERPALPLHDDDPEALGADSDFAPGADRRIDLDRALAALPEPQRQALLLCYGADLSHAEAAQVLGWPLGTLKTQVLRAKARLRAQLGDPT